MVERFTILFSAIACLVSLWSIMSALAAKRSAEAAESQARSAQRQADHAETQAEAARSQARAAETQVAIMAQTMSVDHIGTALRYRRIASDLNTAIAELRANLRHGIHAPERTMQLERVNDLLREIEDMPPIFPDKIRRMALQFIDSVARQKSALYIGAETPDEMAQLRALYETTITAMTSQIEQDIAAIGDRAKV